MADSNTQHDAAENQLDEKKLPRCRRADKGMGLWEKRVWAVIGVAATVLIRILTPK